MKNLAASVRARLLNKAKADGEDFTYMLLRYAMERLLYRICVSPYKDLFLLKGASLFAAWFEKTHRRTQDIDLLGYGDNHVETVLACFREIVNIACDDGMEYDSDSMSGSVIKENDDYQGVRLTFFAFLDRARVPMTVEVGFGDTVTPAAVQIRYPVLLETTDVPYLNAYPVYTVLAEKLQTIVKKGMINSRMKDFYDVWFLSGTDFDYSILKQAVIRTFEKRETALDISAAVGLSEAFALNPEKKLQWKAFVKSISAAEVSLPEAVAASRSVLEKALAANGEPTSNFRKIKDE